MQVILTENVANLGSLGDSVKVKDGYARNFLIPRGKAIVAGTKKSREIEHQTRRLEQLRQAAIDKAKSEVEKVSALELSVTARAGANGRLFGSVTNRDLQVVFAEHGYELDRRSIHIHELIKSVGTYTATVRLHTDVKVEVTIHVKPEFVKEAGKEGVSEDTDATPNEAEALQADETAQPDAESLSTSPTEPTEEASAEPTEEITEPQA